MHGLAMRRNFGKLIMAAVAACLSLGLSAALGATKVTSNGITWTFSADQEVGTFVNGDPWVKGPVTVVGITTDLHAKGFTPRPGEDGSMVNPGTNAKQGYDDRLTSYDASLNAGLIGGKVVSPESPLTLKSGSSLVSMVSWLYRSESDAEPGIPRFNVMTKAPRPVTRRAGILTCVETAPAEDSFRPPYCGTDKTIKYNVSQLKMNLLKNLKPVAGTPAVSAVEESMARPWIDHVNEFLGAMVHPSDDMPNYGRDMTHVMDTCALMVQLNFNELPGKPSKQKIVVNLVQYGIDLTGIADNGGSWPANGGHALGRKWPILFAGLMLDDAHMKDVGQWKTRFQEDEQTFIVSQKEVDITHSAAWAPDKRAKREPYEKSDIGLPEWGIWHAKTPTADNKNLKATYRMVNTPAYPGFVLAALLMGQKKAWNHDALFDYTERYMKLVLDGKVEKNAMPPLFDLNMWKAYRGSVDEK